MAPRHDFLNQAAPENYVAGLGRGATGFTTRSDLGPAREGPSEDQIKEALAKRAAALGQAPPTAYGATGKKDEKDDADDDRFQDPENEVGLFASGTFDRDDDEADRIYQAVDEKMDRRRKQRRLVLHLIHLPKQTADMDPPNYREAREQAEQDEYERNNPKIAAQFADLKRALGTVSDDEWANIPEVGDLTGKNRRSKENARQRFYAVPDSVLAGAAAAGGYETSIGADGEGNPAAGANGDNADGTATNFADIGRARDKVLQVRLDQAAQGGGDTDITSGTSTSVDPKGYLTSLQKSVSMGEEANVGDIKRVRGLLESVIKTNPKHAPAWIAAARLEELAGKQVAARNVIARGCDNCPRSEDAWLENIRLNEAHNAKIIAATAIKNNDRSVRLWIEAMNLEKEVRSKKRVLRQALDHIPESVALWKEAVNLEDDPADARLMLHKATEIIPQSVELWLALARLETPDQAQIVLNKARKAVPTSHDIWVAGARLQEQLNESAKVDILMRRAIQSLAKESSMLKREEWITEAETCEAEGAILTCNAIIRETLGWSLDEDDDRKEIWMTDAKGAIGRGHYGTARAIYAYAIRVFVNRKSIWLAAADLERNHGDSPDSLSALLERAVEACPQSEVLWLQLAKEKWQNGLIDDARRVLGKAFHQNPDNEDIWLAAVKLESDTGQTAQARELLATARREAGTDRVWIKSITFERAQGATTTSLELVNDALVRYPRCAKLHMQKGQIYEHDSAPPLLPQAREAYTTGTRVCPTSVALWLLAARLEERAGLVVKARSVLDRARLAIPKSALLWTESVRLERRAGKLSAAQALMARAMQDVPAAEAGLLWAERIWHLEARNQRKSLALEGIKKVDNDPVLFVAVARLFWAERRLEKAANWFEKALVLDPELGDSWAWYMKFLEQHGTPEKRGDVTSKCVVSEPKRGEVWASVAKDPKNAGKGVEEILKTVMQELD
ncbi:hypothetical protein FH972_023066 [Carpinus fangiana]|uniref:PRP1 splicing factor N-terminal domain-containing protein n=1 Tax=Carpinus fangiana TaxID=176857 RepID=A0A5N6KUD3_9ROSI|nr:hypothetical protein FH972_023066 [Carpinus fangiana]